MQRDRMVKPTERRKRPLELTRVTFLAEDIRARGLLNKIKPSSVIYKTMMLVTL